MAANIVDQIALRASAERPALVADGTAVSFGELLERVSAAAAWLNRCPGFHRNGVPRVGLACGNGVNYIVLALAILKAGGCLVPLADELTDPERHEIIRKTGLCGMILGQAGDTRGERSTGAAWVALETGELENEAEFSALDPAFIRFSSGTTGKQQGRGAEPQQTAKSGSWRRTRRSSIGPADRVLWMLPMAHHFAVSIVLYLYHGACTVIGTSHLAEEVSWQRAQGRRGRP